jgi:urease accessory protein
MNGADWRIWQLADSAFPSGGFAHSAGLEAAAACGLVGSSDALDALVRDHLWNVGRASLPFVSGAHDDPGASEAFDAELDAFLTSQVANRASRTQGRAFPRFGAALAALAVERAMTLRLHLFLALRGFVSAAVRLGLVGPHEGQRVQLRHGDTLEAVLEQSSGLTPADAATTAPILDIAGATHDRLYSRLFQS